MSGSPFRASGESFSLAILIGPKGVRASMSTSFGACCLKSARCSGRNSFRIGRCPCITSSTSPLSVFPFSDPEQMNLPGSAFDLHREAAGAPESAGKIGRNYRSQFDRGVTTLADAPSAQDQAASIQFQIRSVEEYDLPQFGL